MEFISAVRETKVKSKLASEMEAKDLELLPAAPHCNYMLAASSMIYIYMYIYSFL